MRPVLILATVFTFASAMAAWTPPENPKAHDILHSARDDRLAGRYEDALAKHLWFHREATKLEPALVGVRGSFAIADWGTLADQYPPAKQAFLAERAAAAKAVEEGRDTLQNFGDVAAFDRELEEYRETYRLFILIEARDEALARRAYRGAQDALIDAKDFARCARYLDANGEIRDLRDMQKSLDRPGRTSFPMEKEIMGRSTRERLGRTVALLVLGGRNADAAATAAKMRSEFKDPELEPVLARALEGQMPEPAFPPEARAMWKKMRR